MILKLLIAIILLFSSLVDAYFYASNVIPNLPFKAGMATATRNNNSLIMFGGETGAESFTNDLYQLTELSETFYFQILPQNNPPPGTLYAQAIVTNNNNDMYLLGGITNTTNERIVPFQNYHYSFTTNTWTPSPNNNVEISNTSSLPLNRQLFSATYDNQNKIYIYGGARNGSTIFADFYSLDLITQQYAQINNLGVGRYGHTASLLSNGQLVIIGGVIQTNSALTLAPMSDIFVFDTRSNQWRVEKAVSADSRLPSTRSAHSATVTSDDRIIIFGGDNGGNQKTRMYLNAVAILDTKTWTWSTPFVGGIPPSRRSYASGGLLNGNHLVIVSGTSATSYYSDINVFDISTNNWLQSFETVSSHTGLSGGMIAGIIIASVALFFIILFLLWKFKGCFRWFFRRIHHDIWKPRTGEPLWAETSRIVFQILLLFIFVVFLVFVIRQAIESPNVAQTFEEPSDTVDVPDVRFCFDGYPTTYPDDDLRAIDVTCANDLGYNCKDYIQPLNMSLFQPTFAGFLGAVKCYLFRAPSEFVLSSTSGLNNGSKLIFTMWGDQSISYGRIHISVYPKQMNPNVPIYNISDSIPSSLSREHILEWQNLERNDLQVSNVYDVQTGTYSAIAYNLIDRQYLQDVKWNYVGFSPITNSTPEVETFFRQEAPSPEYNAHYESIGRLTLYPSAFVKTTQREVKMYTLVNALGFVGGIFGLLVAVQAWLFGFRPRSPWGVVQRWSTGNMKRSLLKGLKSKFKITESGVPLVHPVHHRFSVTDLNDLSHEESEPQRINRVEERIQMLEMLFKAYYVNDEVFRSLGDANNDERSSSMFKKQQSRRVGDSDESDGFASTSFVDTPKSERVIDEGISSSKMDIEYHPLAKRDTD